MTNTRKGIIFAGSAGTRLHPISLTQRKQLFRVHREPMIYYPLATRLVAVIGGFMGVNTQRWQIMGQEYAAWVDKNYPR